MPGKRKAEDPGEPVDQEPSMPAASFPDEDTSESLGTETDDEIEIDLDDDDDAEDGEKAVSTQSLPSLMDQQPPPASQDLDPGEEVTSPVPANPEASNTDKATEPQLAQPPQPPAAPTPSTTDSTPPPPQPTCSVCGRPAKEHYIETGQAWLDHEGKPHMYRLCDGTLVRMEDLQ